MPRTRMHKYKHKICNSRRSIAMNKRKMKTKTKSKSRSRRVGGGGTRKIFKKSHKRYQHKSMKRRIQRGGDKYRQFELLMESYNDSENDKTKDAMKILFGYFNIKDYSKFKKILEERTKLIPEPSLLVVATGNFLSLKTEMMFDFNNYLKLEFKQGQWTELVKHMHSHISAIVSGEQSRTDELTRHLAIAYNTALPAHEQLTDELKNAAANFQVKAAIENAANPLGRIARNPVNLGPTYQSQALKGFIAPIPESIILDTSKFVEPLKTYSTYRLSAGRQGSSNYTNRISDIKRFNEQMNEINLELQNPTEKPGEKLYELLKTKTLIPVYFGKGDSRNDSVPDDKCDKSVRDGLFKTGIFSSGKHHCRTCGRCMNKADKTTYGDRDNMFLNPVCIDCRDLFSRVLHPGGAAASLSSAEQ